MSLVFNFVWTGPFAYNTKLFSKVQFKGLKTLIYVGPDKRMAGFLPERSEGKKSKCKRRRSRSLAFDFVKRA